MLRPARATALPRNRLRMMLAAPSARDSRRLTPPVRRGPLDDTDDRLREGAVLTPLGIEKRNDMGKEPMARPVDAKHLMKIAGVEYQQISGVYCVLRECGSRLLGERAVFSAMAVHAKIAPAVRRLDERVATESPRVSRQAARRVAMVGVDVRHCDRRGDQPPQRVGVSTRYCATANSPHRADRDRPHTSRVEADDRAARAQNTPRAMRGPI